MNIDDISSLKKLIMDMRKSVIIPHINPDGDAIGSSLALMHLLNDNGHTSKIVSPNSIPDFLNWMPGFEKILFYDNEETKCSKIIKDAELIFTLDFNDLLRSGDMHQLICNSKSKIILIDHHQNPKKYADLTFSDPEKGSTSELMYDIFCYLGFEEKINTKISTCIYTGIMTDSGSFKFPSVTSRTHDIVSKLISNGANNSNIHNAVYDNSPLSKIKILGKALENLITIPDLKTSYMHLNKNDLESLNYRKGDTEGIVNYGLSLKGIIFSAMFIEDPNEIKKIKISFRSIGEFSCDKFARKYFSGGGHVNAAGGKDFDTIENTINKFNKLLINYKTDLSK